MHRHSELDMVQQLVLASCKDGDGGGEGSGGDGTPQIRLEKKVRGAERRFTVELLFSRNFVLVVTMVSEQ